MSLHTDPKRLSEAEKISPLVDGFMEERAKAMPGDLSDPGADKLTEDQKTLRAKSGHYDIGHNTLYASSSFAEETEEEKEKNRRRNVSIGWRAADNVLNGAQNQHMFASAARFLTDQFNAHAIDMLPGAKKAAIEAQATADKKFENVEGKTVSAKNEKGETIQVRLTDDGSYVDTSGKRIEGEVVVQDKEVLAAEEAFEQAHVQGHVANVREFQASEVESMRQYEEMKRKELETAQREADPQNIKAKGVNLAGDFGNAAAGIEKTAAEPAFVPKIQPAASVGLSL